MQVLVDEWAGLGMGGRLGAVASWGWLCAGTNDVTCTALRAAYSFPGGAGSRALTCGNVLCRTDVLLLGIVVAAAPRFNLIPANVADPASDMKMMMASK